MAKVSLADLIRAALPEDFDDQLLGLPDGGHACDQKQICMDRLVSNPWINWEAYLEGNPDVQASGLLPAAHFINDGVFEGRRLFVNSRLTASNSPAPDVSVIVPNYNNGAFLEKSIGSLLNQTLKNIEIIVIDDASTDNSAEILNTLAQSDPRLRIIKLPQNQSQHMARKTGVAASSGRYIMFMDPDDYYKADACEIAWRAIAHRYDLVCFGVDIIYVGQVDAGRKNFFARFLALGEPKSFTGTEIKAAIINENGEMNDLLWNKIYEGNYCRAVFAKLEDKYIQRGEDTYEAVALGLAAKSAARIQDKLYVYRYGGGISETTMLARGLKASATATSVYGCIERLFLETGNNHYSGRWKNALLGKSLAAWLPIADPRTSWEYLQNFAHEVGIIELVSYLAKEKSNLTPEIVEALGIIKSQMPAVTAYTVGIHCASLAEPSKRRVILSHIQRLLSQGKEVTIYLEEATEADLELPNEVEAVYLGAFRNGQDRLESVLRVFYSLLKARPIGRMEVYGTDDANLVWKLMLFRLMGARIDLVLPPASLKSALNRLPIEKYLTLLNCADRVYAGSRAEAMRYKLLGVDARYLSYTLCHSGLPVSPAPGRDIILVTVIDLSRAQNWQILLDLMEDIHKECSGIRLYVHDCAASPPNLDNFYKQIVQRNLSENLLLRSWVGSLGDADALLIIDPGYPQNEAALAAKHGNIPIIAARDAELCLVADLEISTGSRQKTAEAILAYLKRGSDDSASGQPEGMRTFKDVHAMRGNGADRSPLADADASPWRDMLLYLGGNG